MLRIRLRRVGKKGHAYYRVVVADQRSPRDGAFLESLGAYNPHGDPPEANFDVEHAREWIAKGARPSEAVEKILKRAASGSVAVAEPPAAEADASDAPAAEEAAPEASAATADASDAGADADTDTATADAEGTEE